VGKGHGAVLVVDVHGLDAWAASHQLHHVLNILAAVDQHAVVGGALDQLAELVCVGIDRLVPFLRDGSEAEERVDREDDDDGEEQGRQQPRAGRMKKADEDVPHRGRGRARFAWRDTLPPG
jgi:hypothetical protein